MDELWPPLNSRTARALIEVIVAFWLPAGYLPYLGKKNRLDNKTTRYIIINNNARHFLILFSTVFTTYKVTEFITFKSKKKFNN